MPIYLVLCPKDSVKKHLVAAKSKSQAIRHVASKVVTAEVASPAVIVEQMQAGVQAEQAGDDSAE